MKWLKNIHIKNRKTQEQIAELVQVARGAYANIENGKCLPSVEVAKRIAAGMSFE